MAWIRVQKIASGEMHLISTDIQTRQPVGLAVIQLGPFTAEYAIGIQDGLNFPTYIPFTTHNPVDDVGTWVHWAVTMLPLPATGQTNIQVYRYGVQLPDGILLGEMFVNSIALQWSCPSVSIGDVRSYNSILTSDQIYAASQGASSFPPPSLWYYNMTAPLLAPVRFGALVAKNIGNAITQESMSAVMLDSASGVGMWAVQACACASNPCANGGVCKDFIGDINSPDTYNCTCSSRFNGTHCEFSLGDVTTSSSSSLFTTQAIVLITIAAAAVAVFLGMIIATAIKAQATASASDV